MEGHSAASARGVLIMTEEGSQPIIVGISEAGESEGALRFAIDEAVRQHCGIRIMHALSTTIPPPPGDPLIKDADHPGRIHHFVNRSESAAAYRLITDVAERAREMSDGKVTVETDAPVGRRVHAIIEAAEDARLIVLQHRDLSIFERVFVHSTSIRVSARAHCPVVTVPPKWVTEPERKRVTVGIEKFEGSAAILRIAFESASRRGARLDVVHGWKFMNADADIIASRSLADEWQVRSEKELEDLLKPWQSEFPQVEVESHIAQKGASEVLLEHSKESDLLILGRYRDVAPLALPLGSIARALVNGAHCPVEIVPHSESHKSKKPHNGKKTLQA